MLAAAKSWIDTRMLLCYGTPSIWSLLSRIQEDGFLEGCRRFYFFDTRLGNVQAVRKVWYLVPEDEFDSALESKMTYTRQLTEEEQHQIRLNLMLRREIAHLEGELRALEKEAADQKAFWSFFFSRFHTPAERRLRYEALSEKDKNLFWQNLNLRERLHAQRELVKHLRSQLVSSRF